VDVLKVEHVIVCGHYNCGGVRAVVEKRDVGLANNWLRHLADVADKFSDKLAKLPDDHARMRRLCELNIIEQVRNVCESTIVLGAWRAKQPLTIHGWSYSLEDGLLQDVLNRPVSSLAESLELPYR
jgi:carbonic anhydrase